MKIESPIDGALWALKKGWKVFPIAKGQKFPAFKGWQGWAMKATEEIVRAYETANPGGNWGLYCGGSGLAVVDLDRPKAPGEIDGADTWAAFAKEGRACPEPVTCRTARGGRHLIYRGQCRSVNRWAPGIDCKSLGGLIVLPGSVFVADDGTVGNYTLERDADPADLPAWVKPAVEAKAVKLERPDDAGLEGSIPNGERNSALVQWAGVLRAQGLSADEITPALLAMNYGRCAVPLAEDEVKAIASSVGRYGRGQAGAVAAFAAAGAVDLSLPPAFDAGEALDVEPPAHRPLLFGVFDRGAAVAITGKSKSRKSWFALQAALHGAAGRPIGPWAAVGEWRALYIDTELQPESLRRRLHAVGRACKISGAQLGGRLRAVALRERLPGTADEAAAVLAGLAIDHAADVLVLDSLYSFSNGREDGEDLLAMVRMLRAIRAAVPGLATLAVRHDGKGSHGDKDIIDRGSGHSVFGRDVDALLALDAGEEEGEFLARWVVRDYASPQEWSARWEAGAFVGAGKAVQPVTASGKRAAQAREARDAKALAAIEDAGAAGIDLAGLAAAIGATRPTALSAAQALVASGAATCEIEEGGRQTKRFFSTGGLLS